MKIRKRISEILRVAQPGDTASRTFDIFILILIGLNVVALVLETVTSIREAAHDWFRWIEIVSVMIFTIEYLLRLWSCVEKPEYAKWFGGRARYARTPFAIIDLLAILPFYLPATGLDLRVVRVVRLFRVFRVAKLARYSNALQVIGRVAKAKREELLVVLSAAVLLLLISSTLIYFAEHVGQPEAFSSIPAAMWWGVCTLTTVGYGDVYPATGLGKVLGSLIALLGIGLFALPAGILGAGFVEEIGKKTTTAKCPHCGGNLEPTNEKT